MERFVDEPRQALRQFALTASDGDGLGQGHLPLRFGLNARSVVAGSVLEFTNGVLWQRLARRPVRIVLGAVFAVGRIRQQLVNLLGRVVVEPVVDHYSARQFVRSRASVPGRFLSVILQEVVQGVVGGQVELAQSTRSAAEWMQQRAVTDLVDQHAA